jgi:trans-aconitate 2-methyltransferase
VEEPGFYHSLLAPRAENIDIWETEYLQVLEGENPVKEWTKGTWLTRYLDVLQGPDKAAFEAAYGERVAKAYPQNSAGQTLFPFRRLFMVAQRKT